MINPGLQRTPRGEMMNAFVPDPDKSQVTSEMTGTKVFVKGITGNVDITKWFAISVTPLNQDAGYYFNGDTTKTKTLPSGAESVIFVFRDNIDKVTINFGEGTAEVQGM